MKRVLQLSGFLLVVFVAGAISGWFLRPVNMIDDAGKRQSWQSGTPEERAEAILSELTEELGLSESQVTTIRPIIEQNFRKSTKIDRERMRLRKTVHDETVTAIREHLDTEQVQKLNGLNDSSNRRFQRAMEPEE